MSTSNNDNLGSCCPKTQDLIEDPSRFRADDKLLMETGMFSDCQLKSGNRVWNVHKSIVCLRSYFIEDRFETKANVFDVSFCTEKQVELFLEYVYSGKIETIANFSLADSVEISVVARKFIVPSMNDYAKKVLWDKLKNILRAVSTVLPTSDARHRQNAIDDKLNQFSFHEDFKAAVDKAHEDYALGSQMVLADFVWAGRAWLIRHPIIEGLNNKHREFGRRVLTSLNKGPQSYFIQADGQLTSAADTPPATLCANCARAQAERPSQDMELFDPENL